MNAKHTKGPWLNREGEIIADTRTQTCCGSPAVGAEYMGQQEMVCCGCPDLDGCEEDVIARVTYEQDIPLVSAAPELLEALQWAASALQSVARDGAAHELDEIRMLDGGSKTIAQILDLADAALGKATGEAA